MYWPALKPSPAKRQPPPEASPMAASSVLPDLDDADDADDDDGWVVLPPVAKPRGGRPPRPPPRGPSSSSAAAAATGPGSDDGSFHPTPDEIVRRYLPLRRALRCDALPRQIHDADVYAAHPGFLAAVYPAANGRPEWFFFVCRAQCPGGRRRAGPGAYRLGSEARLLGGAAYCHAFRYYEDDAELGSASTRETEWRMDEYGERAAGAAAADFDMVVCKLYTARGEAAHNRPGVDSATLRADADASRPQVLVRLYLESLSLGDPRRCRMYAAAAGDVFAAHPAVLTAAFPAANDRCEWFFAVRTRTRDAAGDAQPRRAGPGTYVPVREGRAVNGKGEDMGYRRVFLYREDDEAARRVSRTEWWMEECGFGRDFPFSKLPAVAEASAGEDHEELVLYKLYIKLVGDPR